MPAGRPAYEVTDEVVSEVERMAGQGLTNRQIGQCLGISHQTFSVKQNQYSEFADAVKRGRAKGLDTITNALFTTARDGNVTAQIFYLKNRNYEEWNDRKELVIDDKTTKLLELSDNQLEHRRNEVLGITSETTH
jgi:hypothetical protein